ncbi:hypothetical protein H632_c5634p0 [Helicosporidium sp. ATCC 50920]|nr:hypothetical protein H632_c5634p0 [Helicosporidium sp. ATCC 50920]|eukprot:KDD71177.1 hypothetical protein H632_c5634p0 [Helicosporidium sp. ATCC 50920]
MRPLPPSLRPEANETSPAVSSCPEYEQTCRDQCGTTEEPEVTCGDPANGVEPTCKCLVRPVAPTGVDTPEATNGATSSTPPTNGAARQTSGVWSVLAAAVAAVALALL